MGISPSMPRACPPTSYIITGKPRYGSFYVDTFRPSLGETLGKPRE